MGPAVAALLAVGGAAWGWGFWRAFRFLAAALEYSGETGSLDAANDLRFASVILAAYAVSALLGLASAALAAGGRRAWILPVAVWAAGGDLAGVAAARGAHRPRHRSGPDPRGGGLPGVGHRGRRVRPRGEPALLPPRADRGAGSCTRNLRGKVLRDRRNHGRIVGSWSSGSEPRKTLQIERM